MHGPMPLWSNPAVIIVAACAIISAVCGLIVLLVRALRRPRPTMPLPYMNPLPPGDDAIAQIRREVDENEKRHLARMAQEDADRERRRLERELEREWIADGEIELRKKNA